MSIMKKIAYLDNLVKQQQRNHRSSANITKLKKEIQTLTFEQVMASLTDVEVFYKEGDKYYIENKIGGNRREVKLRKG